MMMRKEKSSGDDADDEDEDEDKDGAVMIRLIAESPSTSHPLPLSPPIILPHTRASMAMMRVAAPSTYCLAPRSETPPSVTPPLLLIPLPTSSPPLLLHSTDRKAEYMRHDTNEISVQLRDAHDDRLLMIGQLNLLRRDRRFHAYTARLMEILAQQTEIENLLAANRRRQTQLTEALTLMRTWQTQMAALKSQQGPARGPSHPDVPEEAGKKGTKKKTTRTVRHNAAYAMTYTNLKKMMTDKYCPRGEINKLEIEMWNLKVKGTDWLSITSISDLAIDVCQEYSCRSDKNQKYVVVYPHD
ncbi:hypothetical protein Tco_0296241 [Tanacetum coccineum]